MARQAIPKRTAPADTTIKKPVQVSKAGVGVPDVFAGIIHDITHGTQDLVQMGKESANRLRERYNKIKSFVEDR